MKTVLIVLGFAGASLIGAASGHVLFTDEAPEATAPAGLEELRARVDDLSRQVTRLSDEVRAGRDAAVFPNSPSFKEPGSVAGEPVSAAGEAIEQPEDPAAAFTDEDIEKKVVETVQKIAKAQKEAQAKKWEEGQRQKEAAWLADQQKQLGLTDYQVDELKRLLISRRKAMGAYKWRLGTLGANPPAEKKAALEQAMKDYSSRLDGELRKLLNADQYESMVGAARRRAEEKRKAERR